MAPKSGKIGAILHKTDIFPKLTTSVIRDRRVCVTGATAHSFTNRPSIGKIQRVEPERNFN
jgi:hypothetical protein